MRKPSWAAALLLAVALVSAACGGGSDNKSADKSGATDTTAPADPLVIGLAISKTGFNAAVAQEFLQGLQIWQDMVNNNTGLYADRKKAKGLAGRPVELKFDDDQSKADESAKLYEKYITADGVDLVLPPYGSGATGAVGQILARHKYALIGSSAASESIYKQGLTNMVMTVPASSMWLAALPDLLKKQNLKSVSMVTLDNPFTLDSDKFLKAQFGGNGVNVVGSETFASGNKDFTPIWTKVKAANPDVVVLQAFGPDTVTAMKQAAEQKLSPKLWAISAGAWRNDVFLNGVGPAVAECVVGDAQWNTTLTEGGSKEFAKAYIAKHGDPAAGTTGSDPSAAWGFAAGQVLTEAIDALGAAALTDQQKLVDYVKSGKVKATVLGKLVPDATTGINTAGTPGLFQIQDGKRVIVAPTGQALRLCSPKG
jgi:branched-chain amino acid transport system substrate-binding protein